MGLEKKCVADNGMAFGNAAGDFFVLDGAADERCGRTGRWLLREINLLEKELEDMLRGDHGIGSSVVMDYRKGYPQPQGVTGFDGELYDRRRKILEMATAVFGKDNLLDDINAEATGILADYIREHPETAHTCVDLVGVFRKLERSGDHITNIAEEIVFFIDAKVLKHSGKVDENYPKS